MSLTKVWLDADSQTVFRVETDRAQTLGGEPIEIELVDFIRWEEIQRDWLELQQELSERYIRGT